MHGAFPQHLISVAPNSGVKPIDVTESLLIYTEIVESVICEPRQSFVFFFPAAQ